MPKDKHARPRTEPAPWEDIVLVCGKCLRKAGRETLRGELKRALRDAGVRGLRPVETGCLDLCPKRAISFARGGDLAGPARLQVFDEDVGIEAVVAWLRRD